MNPEQLIAMVMQGKMNMSQLAAQMMQGRLQGHPAMNLFNQMMHGKNNSQKWDTLLNTAQSNNVDINEKRFSEQQLRNLGIIK